MKNTKLKHKKYFLFFVALFIFMNEKAFAETDLDAAVSEAQALLKNENQRNELIKNNPKAQQADSFALQAVGGKTELKNEIYNISSDIFAVIEKQAQGNPEKMQELLLKALQNPSAFLKDLPAAEKAKIKDLAQKVEASKTKASGSPKP